MATFEFRGQVISKLTGNGYSPCRIELWSISAGEPAFSGKSVNSNNDGSFLLSGKIDPIDHNNYFYYLKANQDSNTIGESSFISADSVLDKVVKTKIEIMPSITEGEMMVYGIIQSSDGTPQEGVKVIAYDKTLTGLTNLEETTTGEYGEYVIGYSYPTVNSSKLNADLIIKVFASNEADPPLVVSPLFLSASSTLRVNLSIDIDYKGTTEFEKVNLKAKSHAEIFTNFLDPLCDPQVKITKIGNLTHSEIAYLSNETSVSPLCLTNYFQALSLNIKLDLISYENSLELLYGILKFLGGSDPRKLFFTSTSEIINTIEKAQTNNFIKTFIVADCSSYISSLKTAFVSFLANTPNTDLQSLFSSINVTDPEAKQVILSCFKDYMDLELNDKRTADLVSDIRSKTVNTPSLTTNNVDILEWFLRFLNLTGNIKLVAALFETNTLNTIDLLISNSESDLAEIIAENQIDLPEGVISAQEYADRIIVNLSTTYPEKFLINSIKKSTATHHFGDLKSFFTENPQFPFLSDTIDELFAQYDPDVELDDIPIVKEQLGALQRLYKLTYPEERFNAIEALWQNNLFTSHDINGFEESTFIDLFVNSFQGESSKATSIGSFIYRFAYLQSFISLNAFTSLGNQVNAINPGIIQATNDPSKALIVPTLTDLFGGNGCYKCPEGRSVLSPAAYLADLLRFKVTVGVETCIKDVNQIRFQRPDIAELRFDNKNTITRLPYIDIVNELLASVIINNTTGTYAKTYNTTLEEDTLRAFPEHLDKLDAAFRILMTSVYPWSLPFDYWAEESREWYKRLGVPKYRLMDVFPYLDGQFSPLPGNGTSYFDNPLQLNPCVRYFDIDVAKEYLNISKNDEGELIADFFDEDLIVRYGGMNLFDLIDILKILKSTGLSFIELRDRLESYYVNEKLDSGSRLKIVLHDKELSTGTHIEDCDLTKAFISYSSAPITNPEPAKAFLKKLYRFCRLMRCAKVSVRDLDLLLSAFNYNVNAWVPEMFTKFYEVLRLCEEFSLSLEQVLIWYSDFNTNSYEGITTLYDELFRNPTFNNPCDDYNLTFNKAFDPDPSIDESEKSTLDSPIVREVIYSALNISEEEYYFILNKEGLMYRDGTLIVKKSTVINLSKIYRVVSFCRSFQIPFTDYYQILALSSGLVPLKKGSHCGEVKDTRHLIKIWSALQSSGFSIVDLRTVLSANWSPSSTLVPSFEYNRQNCLKIGQKLYDESLRLVLVSGLDLAYQKEIVIKNLTLIFDGNDSESLSNMNIIINFLERPSEELLNPPVFRLAFSEDRYEEVISALFLATDIYERYQYVIEFWNFPLDTKKNAALRELLTPFVPKEKLDDAVTLVATYDYQWPGELKENYISIITNYFSTFLIADQAIQVLGIGSEQDGVYEQYNKRCNYILKSLITHFVHQVLLKEFGLLAGISIEQSIALLDHWVYSVQEPLKVSSAIYLDPAFIEKFSIPQDSIIEEITDQVYTLDRLIRASVFVKKYNISAKICEFIANHFGNYNILNIFNLPYSVHIESGISTIETEQQEEGMNRNVVLPPSLTYFPEFEQWFNLDKAFKLDNQYANKPYTLFDIWGEPFRSGNDVESICNLLAKATGWNYTDIFYLMKTGEHYTAGTDFVNLDWIEKLADEIFIYLKFKVTPYSIIQRNNIELNMEDVMAIRGIARGTQGKQAWYKSAQVIMDPLRKRLRDAMVQFLVSCGYSNSISNELVNFSSVNALYDHFFIDTQMNPCATTSRIVQSTLALQLFVQRVQLKLEERVSLSIVQASKWEWYKHYRVWEACRKIFLYPENWLEPQWRINKTELFNNLENRLKQNDVTQEIAEKVFFEYFEELENIGKIEIASIFREDINEPGTEQHFITHFLGRTRSHPHTFYYRMFTNYSWTEWKKIDAEIESENATLVVWEGIPYLFWPIVTSDKIKAATILKDGVEIPFPKYSEFLDFQESDQIQDYNYLREDEYNAAIKIKVCYTCRVNEKWQPKKVSKESLFVNHSILVFKWDIGLNWKGYKTWKKCQSDKISIFPISHRDKPDCLDLSLVFGALNLDESLVMRFTFDRQKRFLFYQDYLPYYGSMFDDSNPLKSYQLESEGYEESQSIVGEIGKEVIVYNELEDQPHVPLFQKPQYINRISYGNTLFYRKEGNLFDQTNKLLMPFVFDEPEHIWYGIPYAFKHKSALPVKQVTGLFSKIINASLNSLITTKLLGDETIIIENAGSFYTTNDNEKIILGDLSIGKSINIVKGDGLGRIEPTAFVYNFYAFDHHFINTFRTRLNQLGITGLFNPTSETDLLFRQKESDALDTILEDLTATPFVQSLTDFVGIDFYNESPYAIYNWELFFHVPMMIAGKLTANKQFSDAQKWYHFIFDPTFTGLSSDTDQQRSWKFGPFFNFDGDSDIRELMHQIVKLQSQIPGWQANPDNPFAIADLRIYSYKRNVVMKYLDNLIAWGDDLFEQDTMETLNEATQLYILAYEILGPHPIPIDTTFPDAVSFSELDTNGGLDDFSNKLEVIETYYAGLQTQDQDNSYSIESAVTKDLNVQMGLNPTIYSDKNVPIEICSLYFGIPYNDKLLGYWDIVEDRLYKLRNCLNIKGIFQELPLFAPPIDPALLVQAGSLGLDLSQVMNNQSMALAPYRFRAILQRAKEIVGEVVNLGSSLLSALEKKDSEYISALKSGQEKTLLNLITYVKQQAVKEAENSMSALEESLTNAQNRQVYYKSRIYMNDKEKEYLSKMTIAHKYQTTSQELLALRSILSQVPQIHIGLTGGTEYGGVQLAVLPEVASQIYSIKSSISQYESSVASIYASYDRRMDDWQLQSSQAEGEMKSLKMQIAAANIRLAISQKELENHEKQIEQSEETYDFLRNKFTNEELYDWMINEISSVYFQSYKLGVQYARQAEKAYQFEMATGSIDNFISYGHWDSLRQGLLAGERLRMELNLLDKAYFDSNVRENEITKQVSLTLLNPSALYDLKTTGKCVFSIPEMLYDIDFPGQYMRRIKSVALTIPAVVGPYTNVSCQLSLTKSCYRHDPKCDGTANDYSMKQDDPHFVFNPIGIQSISTSNGQNDRGMFEFNFNDERYLPFEGAGAISHWQLELPDTFRQFDYQTIADIILHISYSSRDAGGLLKEGCLKNLAEKINLLVEDESENLLMAIDWKAQFPDELYKLKTTPTAITTFKLRKDQFPAFVTNYLAANSSTKKLYITGLTFYTKGTIPSTYHIVIGSVNANSSTQTPIRPEYLGIHSSSASFGDGIDLGEEKQLSINTSGTPTIDNIWMMVQYRIGS